ncbi:hypothetical protein L6452_10719 [Arctium lappa]|uniref:Uncharacterized protein n=1 Tax=Arctium lappa TaxID=4217 RepID=A0ACB9DNG6_ARCLA|nr:hypothetical protein L6452_10719 [Arctium lappa]
MMCPNDEYEMMLKDLLVGSNSIHSYFSNLLDSITSIRRLLIHLGLSYCGSLNSLICFSSGFPSSGQLNDLMESKAGKKSGSRSFLYEAPLGYGIEDVRPNGGLKKFKSAVYSNCTRKPS